MCEPTAPEGPCAFSVSLLSCLVSHSRWVAEQRARITSRRVQVTKILNSDFSEESLEEYWTGWKESRKSGPLGGEWGLGPVSWS